MEEAKPPEEVRSAPAGPIEPDFAGFRGQLLARIRRMMGPDARDGVESSDILQSVYVEALREPRPGELAGKKLLPWMTRVARHKIVDETRRRRGVALAESDASDRAAESSSSLASRLVRLEDRRMLARALSDLDPERRRVIALRCEDGLPWDRIAAEIGRSEEAARKLYHRALVELGRILAVAQSAARPGSG